MMHPDSSEPEFPPAATWQVIVLLVALVVALVWFSNVMYEYWATRGLD
jgi:hypothetical protein